MGSQESDMTEQLTLSTFIVSNSGGFGVQHLKVDCQLYESNSNKHNGSFPEM